MSDVVERAKAALEGITKGPWRFNSRKHPGVVMTPYGCLWHPGRGEVNNGPDGEFIVAARELVPELVAELEARERQVSRLAAEVERLQERA